MTFGEHLDELRVTLIKSILALVVGFLIALVFARGVAQYMQKPLKDALNDYYTKLGQRDYLKQLAQEHPGAKAESLDAAGNRLLEQRLIPEDRYISRQEYLELLKSIQSKGG